MKNFAVLISGAAQGDNLRDVQVQPGSTAGDVLRALNLAGYLLSREGSAQHFAEEEEIYHLPEGTKLRATPIAEVGGFWSELAAWLFGGARVVNKFQAPPATARPAPRARAVPSVRRSATGRGRLVEPDRRQLYEIRGWRQQGNKLVGAFRTRFGSYAGEISLDGARPSFLIINPPEVVLRGPHAACFRPRGNGRYHIHFGISNPDLDAQIVAVEKLLTASLLQGR